MIDKPAVIKVVYPVKEDDGPPTVLIEVDGGVFTVKGHWFTEPPGNKKLRSRRLRSDGERIINQYGIDMTDWPITHYGSERACKHGVGHPAPDRKHHSLGVHGCDGCCSGWVPPTSEQA